MSYELLAWLAKGGTLEDWIHIQATNEYFRCRSKELRVSPLTQGEHLHLIYR